MRIGNSTILYFFIPMLRLNVTFIPRRKAMREPDPPALSAVSSTTFDDFWPGALVTLSELTGEPSVTEPRFGSCVIAKINRRCETPRYDQH